MTGGHTLSIDLDAARKEYHAHFGFPAETVVRAPGRVNIIGEHTDYNHGFVLPMAIEQETVILARQREDGVLNAFAANLERSVVHPLGTWERDADEPWIDYVVGVAYELSKLDQPLHGSDLMIIGDVPIGAGLSSSASLEMAALTLFEQLAGFTMDGPEAAKLGQRVENGFLGVNSGIMDQFVARMGRKDHALFLDCRSLDYERVPVAFSNAKFVIANTGVSRGLTASKYNERVAECAEAVRIMCEIRGESATHLRDFALSDLLQCKDCMPDNAFRRAHHIMTENERTQAACRAMREGNAAGLGTLMNFSDTSLREDYEVTCAELDAMTAIARTLPGCFGARMTGAGFGGCTVQLVAGDQIEAFSETLMTAYKQKTGIEGSMTVSSPADGASAVNA
jgi:galactokinase